MLNSSTFHKSWIWPLRRLARISLELIGTALGLCLAFKSDLLFSQCLMRGRRSHWVPFPPGSLSSPSLHLSSWYRLAETDVSKLMAKYQSSPKLLEVEGLAEGAPPSRNAWHWCCAHALARWQQKSDRCWDFVDCYFAETVTTCRCYLECMPSFFREHAWNRWEPLSLMPTCRLHWERELWWHPSSTFPVCH